MVPGRPRYRPAANGAGSQRETPRLVHQNQPAHNRVEPAGRRVIEEIGFDELHVRQACGGGAFTGVRNDAVVRIHTHDRAARTHNLRQQHANIARSATHFQHAQARNNPAIGKHSPCDRLQQCGLSCEARILLRRYSQGVIAGWGHLINVTPVRAVCDNVLVEPGDHAPRS